MKLKNGNLLNGLTKILETLLDRSKEVRDKEYKLRECARQLNSSNANHKHRGRNIKIQVQTSEGECVEMKRETNG